MSAVRVSPLKWLVVVLGAVIVLLQYRLWLSDDGVRGVAHMRAAVAAQQQQNAALTQRNRQLAAEVRDLKTGMSALEERARSELGMIAGNETYYQVVPGSANPGGQVVPGPVNPGGQVVPGPVNPGGRVVPGSRGPGGQVTRDHAAPAAPVVPGQAPAASPTQRTARR